MYFVKIEVPKKTAALICLKRKRQSFHFDLLEFSIEIILQVQPNMQWRGHDRPNRRAFQTRARRTRVSFFPSMRFKVKNVVFNQQTVCDTKVEFSTPVHAIVMTFMVPQNPLTFKILCARIGLSRGVTEIIVRGP